MKKLKFLRVKILSLKEKAGKIIDFDENFSVISGDNDTGKSSLLKSIYFAFGAEPKFHDEWKSINPIVIVKFLFEGTNYTIMRHRNNITMLDGDSKIIHSSNSITNGFSPFFSDFFNFKIDLKSNNTEEIIQATPAFCLMPFYVDQDTSWTKSWNSFQRLGQFSSWKKDVAEFHAGMKSSEYYKAKSELSITKKKIDELEKELAVIQSIYESSIKEFKDVEVDMDVNDFKKEIDELIKKTNNHKNQLDKIKEKLRDEYNKKQIFENQIDITEKSLNEINSDYHFCVDKLGGDVDCPTCGAHYENSFSERFAIAKDESSCFDLLNTLKSDLSKTNRVIEKIKEDLFLKNDSLDAINELLATKRKHITFLDYINSKSSKNLLDMLDNKIIGFKESIGKLLLKSKELKKQMKLIDNPTKRKKIREDYRQNMKVFLNLLNVENLKEDSYKNIDCTINESGSDLPRALLAYYSSILNVIKNNSQTSTFFPIIIDSPKQQEQDIRNEIAILNFLKSELPSESQIIIGLVDSGNVEFPGKRIKLTEKLHLLNKHEYDPCFKEYTQILEKESQLLRE